MINHTDYGPKPMTSLQIKIPLEIHFLGPLEGGKWFYFFLHFDPLGGSSLISCSPQGVKVKNSKFQCIFLPIMSIEN